MLDHISNQCSILQNSSLNTLKTPCDPLKPHTCYVVGFLNYKSEITRIIFSSEASPTRPRNCKKDEKWVVLASEKGTSYQNAYDLMRQKWQQITEDM